MCLSAATSLLLCCVALLLQASLLIEGYVCNHGYVSYIDHSNIGGEDLQIYCCVHLCHGWGPPLYIDPMAATQVLYIILRHL